MLILYYAAHISTEYPKNSVFSFARLPMSFPVLPTVHQESSRNYVIG
jgi:hypothetical protein